MRIKAIIVHHSASSRNTTVLDIDNWHRRRWPNFRSSLGYWVGYQYVIDYKGIVTQTRKDTEEGAHTLGGWNRKSIGIALIGHLERENASEWQLRALDGLLRRLRRQYSIPRNRIYAHKELWSTLCPGKNLIPHIVRFRKGRASLPSLHKQLARIREMILQLKKRLLKWKTIRSQKL